jgi:hypothetical protein
MSTKRLINRTARNNGATILSIATRASTSSATRLGSRPWYSFSSNSFIILHYPVQRLVRFLRLATMWLLTLILIISFSKHHQQQIITLCTKVSFEEHSHLYQYGLVLCWDACFWLEPEPGEHLYLDQPVEWQTDNGYCGGWHHWCLLSYITY